MIRGSLLAAVWIGMIVINRPLLAQRPVEVPAAPQDFKRPGVQDPNEPGEKQPDTLRDFDLRLIGSLKDVSQIPRTGKKLIILAAVGDAIHLRIFDDDGSMVEDSEPKTPPEIDLKRVDGGLKMVDEAVPFKEKLKGLWPPHELNASERTKVIGEVDTIFKISAVHWWTRGPEGYKKVYEIMKKNPFESGTVDKEVRVLLLARRDAEIENLLTLAAFYREGQITPDRLIGSVISALRSQLELLESPADQVMIYELILEFAGDLERREAAELEVFRATRADLAQARIQRINCEIDLLKAKRKLPKK
jgi:hypothetical protein